MSFAVSLTTVTQAATDTALVSRSAFKKDLGIAGTADDGYIDALIAQASTLAARHCNRVFPVETILDEFWPERDAYPFQVRGGVAPLQLSRWPVVTVASVSIDDVALVDGIDFRADLARGQLVRLGPWRRPCIWTPGAIAVAYSAGYASIPADLADVVTRMVKARWFARRRDPMVRGETIPGVYEATFWFGAGPNASGGMPPDVAEILDSYRVPVIG